MNGENGERSAEAEVGGFAQRAMWSGMRRGLDRNKRSLLILLVNGDIEGLKA
jgi:hypothetical protein